MDGGGPDVLLDDGTCPPASGRVRYGDLAMSDGGGARDPSGTGFGEHWATYEESVATVVAIGR
jgi:hypothetical protein